MGLKQDRGAPPQPRTTLTHAPARRSVQSTTVSRRRDPDGCRFPALPVLSEARGKGSGRRPLWPPTERTSVTEPTNTIAQERRNTATFGYHAATRLSLMPLGSGYAGIGRYVDIDQWRCPARAARSASQCPRCARAYSNEVQRLPFDSPTRTRAAAWRRITQPLRIDRPHMRGRRLASRGQRSV